MSWRANLRRLARCAGDIGWKPMPQLAAAACVALIAVQGVSARQPPVNSPSSPDDAVEAYVERLGMTRLLAEQLAVRLRTIPKDQKVGLAERLGKIYVQLLMAAVTPEDRKLWEQRGRNLLRDVPEADTSDLRLSLNKAVYARAEESAERVRLRLAEPAEAQEAERSLRELEPQFTEIAGRAHRRVETLERVEKSGEATDVLSTELASARRTRSLAFYYAGWCHYYIGFLGRAPPEAVEALKCFGWLLNSPNGRAASPDKLPTALLRYDHIARSAIGAALACGLRGGGDGDAVRWLDAVEESAEISDAIRDQVALRRITILSDAKRWADLEYFLRKLRNADRHGGGKDVRPLGALQARLLAVQVLEADKRVAREQIEGLAKIALGDLVTRQEVGQVLDLVRRYGTTPIGDSGFIVFYVRGLLEYDAAREEQRKLDPSPTAMEEPTTDAATVNLYQAATKMLDAALRQEDAATFKRDQGKAAVMLGRSLFFAGELEAAGERFAGAWELCVSAGMGGAESAGKAGGGDVDAQEALWLAVVAMDRAAKAAARAGPTTAPSRAAERRTELATLFLQTYPESPRAARIVLMQAAAADGGVSDDEALRILSEVPKTSPVYEPARRQVARMLYAKMRAARGTERDFAAMRFVGVSEELLGADQKLAMEGKGDEARAACERLVARVRQMLEALLGGSSPDATRARAVLEVLNAAATYNRLDLGEHEAELMFRRLQIALATEREGGEAEAIGLGDRLAGMGARAGQFAAAADRVIYKRVAARWKHGGGGAESAGDAALVVRFGSRVIAAIGEKGDPLGDPAVLSLYSTVAAAATSLAGDGESAMRQTAIKLDEAILRAQPRTEESLRRLAGNAETTGDVAAAIECWRTLFAGSQQGSDRWFEARFESVRLVAKLDKGRAAELMAQHRRLYPEFGPSPWGEKLRALADEVGATAEPLPAATGGGPTP